MMKIFTQWRHPTLAPNTPVVARANARRLALWARGQFWEISAGLLKSSTSHEEKSRPWHYFGNGQVVQRAQGGGFSQQFSAVRLLGSAAQDAILAELAQNSGNAVPFLCWQGDTPAAVAAQSGNGFKGQAQLSAQNDGDGDITGANRLRFTLHECAARQAGTVQCTVSGITFAPLGAPLAAVPAPAKGGH